MARCITSRSVSVAAKDIGIDMAFSHSSFTHSVFSNSSSMYIGAPKRMAMATASDVRTSSFISHSSFVKRRYEKNVPSAILYILA